MVRAPGDNANQVWGHFGSFWSSEGVFWKAGAPEYASGLENTAPDIRNTAPDGKQMVQTANLGVAEFFAYFGSLFCVSQIFSAYFGFRRVFLAYFTGCADISLRYFGSRIVFFESFWWSQSCFQFILGVAEFFSAKTHAPDSRLGLDQANVRISRIPDHF